VTTPANGNVSPVASASTQRTLRSLTFVVAVQWMGATLGLPLLPLYLEAHGGTPRQVGIIMASFFAAGLATQYVAGRQVDRSGRRRVLVSGLIAYAVASVAFVLPLSALWYTIARAFQGAGAGAIEVASLSTVSALVPEVERGRAISRIYAAQLTGIAAGPVVGALVPLDKLGWAFVAAAAASVIAAIIALRSDLGERTIQREVMEPVRRSDQFYGAVVGAVAVGLCVGVYESCWSLLMKNHHASTLQIRLSWTLFALPFALLAPVGGWLADHANRRVISQLGMFNAAFFLFLYPNVHNNVALLLLAPLESIGASLSLPSTSSLLTQGARPREMGRRQGVSTTANTAALTLSAAVAGVMFAVNPNLPFFVIAAVSAAFTASNFWWWRHVKGHIAPT
jgi:DHA1 family multidrug resistance protein-like MFS transporter